MYSITRDNIKKLAIVWLAATVCGTAVLLFLSNSLIVTIITIVLLAERTVMLISALSYGNKEAVHEEKLRMNNITLSKENWDLRREVDAVNLAYSQVTSNNGRVRR